MKPRMLVASVATLALVAPSLLVVDSYLAKRQPERYFAANADATLNPIRPERLSAIQLATAEALRLSAGQMAGNPREQSGTQRSLADQQDDRATVDALQAYLYQPSAGPFEANNMEVDLYPVTPSLTNKFTSSAVNGFVSTATAPVSTFSADVDTASYSFARRMIDGGTLPDPDAVRVEEMVNYFPYAWQGPKSADAPFKANVTVMPTPWDKGTRLLHIGVKGYDVAPAAQTPANIVFLVDVSGSMDEPDKLPLLKSSFKMFVGKMKATDTVSIVTYADGVKVVLGPTKASDVNTIDAALDSMQASGSTNGEGGLQAAYRQAEQSFVKDGVNRIFLATDGDFNVGQTSEEQLKQLVETKRKSGVMLSVIGVGADNYHDNTAQILAQNGNGKASYIDNLQEAQKTLVQESSSEMFPIADDVKLQVEFNPTKVASYRLIGYETRALKTEDFNNDKVDAGDIGSGHTVTAIYEIVPAGGHPAGVDPLRYTKVEPSANAETGGDELAYMKIRYKLPGQTESRLISEPVTEGEAVAGVEAASTDVRFSVAVAAFGQKLKHESTLAGFDWDAISKLAADGKGDDAFGYRAEFLRLVDIAKTLPEAAPTR